MLSRSCASNILANSSSCTYGLKGLYSSDADDDDDDDDDDDADDDDDDVDDEPPPRSSFTV